MNLKRLSAALTALCLLTSGCSEIRYGEGVPPAAVSANGAEPTAVKDPIPDKYKQKKFDIVKKDFSYEYAPDRPIVLETGSFTAEVDFVSPQHYRIGIKAAAASAAVSLSVGNNTLGTYYIEGANDYETFYIDNVYIQGGKTDLVFTILRGSVQISAVNAESSSAISSERYKVLPKLSVPNPSANASAVYDYLVSCFGNKTLTAQYCTINTNAELEAVKAASGRYPAIRCGDLANYSYAYNGADKEDNREIELAREWRKSGGIVFFTWSWYAPDGSGTYYADDTVFNLGEAMTKTDISQMDADEINMLADAGEIPRSAALLVRDIDDMAKTLSSLAAEGVPVLWQPLPDGGSRLYWWGDGSGYVWLWRLMFERFSYYHALDNLIWVWSGSEYRFYPGDDCVDIIGESAYNRDFYDSEAVRFGYTSGYTRGKKPAAITGSGGLPSPDVFARDNARWLFWSLYRGDFVIGGDGTVIKETAGAIEKFYNHEGTVCSDQLPNMNGSGIS